MFPLQPKVYLLFKIKRRTSKAIKKTTAEQVIKRKKNQSTKIRKQHKQQSNLFMYKRKQKFCPFLKNYNNKKKLRNEMDLDMDCLTMVQLCCY